MYLRYWLSTSSSTGRFSGPSRWPRLVPRILTQMSRLPEARTPSRIEQRSASLCGGGREGGREGGGRERGREGGREGGGREGGGEREEGRREGGGKEGEREGRDGEGERR